MKKFSGFIFCILLAVSALQSAEAQTLTVAKTAEADRPKVGLVLAGGGAKSAAHIGALQCIEDMGIPVDYVAGTSMGSIVGGLYALGYSPAAIDSLIKSVDWGFYMGNSVGRKHQSYEASKRKNSYQLTIPFGTKDIDDQMEYLRREEKAKAELINNGEFVNPSKSSPLMRSLPSGFIDGNNLLNLFNDLCVGYQDSLDFNSLPIPYACVATNLTTGDPVILRSGRLPMAMRSSMAIPFVFSPVEYDGDLLVDGGLVNNFPADLCREMGADIVIGIEMTKGFKADPGEINSLPGVLGQMVNIMTSGHNAENRRICDVYIRPDVSGFGTMSFDAASIDTLVGRGYSEALKHLPELERVKALVGDDKKRLQAPAAGNFSDGKDYVFTQLVYEGISDKESSWLYRKWPVPLGKSVSADELHSIISNYKGTGAFENVSFSISEENQDGGRALRLLFKEAEPHNASFSVRADSEEAAAIGFRFGLNDNRIAGWKFSVLGELSYNPYAELRLRHSMLGTADINLSYDFSYKHAAVTYLGNILAQTGYRRNRVRLYLSDFYSRHSSTRLGVDYEAYTFTQLFAEHRRVTSSPDSLSKSFGAFVNYDFDSLDDPYFATRGLKANLSGNWKYYSFDDLFRETDDSPKGYGDAILRMEGYITPGDGKLTFIPQVSARHIFGVPRYLSFYSGVGGVRQGRYFDHQLPFIGLNGYELVNHSTLAVPRLDIRWNFFGDHYLSFMANALLGFDEGEYADSFFGLGLRYSYNAVLGPISLQVHWSDRKQKGDRLGAYVSLGVDF